MVAIIGGLVLAIFFGLFVFIPLIASIFVVGTIAEIFRNPAFLGELWQWLTGLF